MKLLNKYKDLIAEFIFFVIIFILSIAPLSNFDIWFHVKSGEIISKMGIIHTDVFAYTTTGREWIPYEWLFQLITYYFSHFLGINSIIYLTAALAAFLIFSVFIILRRIFDLSVWTSLFLSFAFFVSTYEFIAPRPQIFAYPFFTLNLFFILLYFVKNKNLLWVTLPITLIWANLHGSIFLDVAFFGMYAGISLISYFIHKDNNWLKKFKVLSLYTIVTFILTILPPLGVTQYRLLWIFYENREVITTFIGEWAPLSADKTPFTFYLIEVIIIFSIFAYSIKKTGVSYLLRMAPFLLLTLSAFTATRNAFYGYVGMLMLLAFSISSLNFINKKIAKKYLILLLSIFLIFLVWLYRDKTSDMDTYMNYYPVKATEFIKTKDLKGNMFNEYGYGGYILYKLYPQQKVYFDGRSDLYLCCEMPETLQFSYNKTLSNSSFKKILDKFWNKHNMSFVVLRTEKNTVLRKIESVLQNDPNWSLVFWDDASVIFVRRDGKNDEIIKKFGTTASTPYEKIPYRKDMEEKAFEEYSKMIKTADSSKSRNTLGYLYLLKQDYKKAEAEFQNAIRVYPYNESPYMNLAEIEVKNGNLDTAILLYKAAEKLAPDRGLIYIRLGQLTLQDTGDIEQAKQIWLEGINKTADNDTKKQLEKLNTQ